MEKQRENIIELLHLIKENPNLPIVPMVASECVCDNNYGYWMGRRDRAVDVDKIIEELKLAEYYPHNISIFGRAADCIKVLQAQLDEKIINAFNNGEWCDTNDICRLLKISFADGLKCFDFSRTAKWNVAGEWIYINKFRIKQNPKPPKGE